MAEICFFRRPQTSARWIVLILPLALAVGGGCGNRTPNQVPSSGDGRQALETALTAWQNGQAVDKLDNASPPIQVVDSDWSKKQQLTKYEILEEIPRTDGRRSFKVRLYLQNPAATQDVHYLVVGNSPLWVFREEDYNSFSNWGGSGGSK
jgi:hypothetical protein